MVLERGRKTVVHSSLGALLHGLGQPRNVKNNVGGF